jgi:hypothetical protein
MGRNLAIIVVLKSYNLQDRADGTGICRIRSQRLNLSNFAFEFPAAFRQQYLSLNRLHTCDVHFQKTKFSLASVAESEVCRL